MADLKDVLERAERAVVSIPLPLDGFRELERYRTRRRRATRVLVFAIALLVAGGSVATLAILRSLDRTTGGIRPASSPSPHASHSPTGELPTGVVSQRRIDGRPAQRVGPFWFGFTDDPGCVRVTPLPIGPSWTLADRGHDCVPPEPPTATLRIGFATGQIHRDARAGSPTTFTAIYGVAPAGAATVTVRWPDGGTASVRATGGRFFLVWSGSVRPVSVTARSAGGRSLGTVRPA